MGRTVFAVGAAGWMAMAIVASDHLAAVERAAQPTVELTERLNAISSDALKANTTYQSAQAAQTPPSPRALLDTYCVACHNERLKTAGVELDTVDVTNVGRSAEVWERVVRKLRAGTMPPVGRPHPEKAATRALVAWLETGLDRAAAASPNPGRPPLHRHHQTGGRYRHHLHHRR